MGIAGIWSCVRSYQLAKKIFKINFQEVYNSVTNDPIKITTLGQKANKFILISIDDKDKLKLTNSVDYDYFASAEDWRLAYEKIKSLSPEDRSKRSSYDKIKKVNSRLLPYLAAVILYFNKNIERTPQTPIKFSK